METSIEARTLGALPMATLLAPRTSGATTSKAINK
jgi:hypothetical protein